MESIDDSIVLRSVPNLLGIDSNRTSLLRNSSFAVSWEWGMDKRIVASEGLHTSCQFPRVFVASAKEGDIRFPEMTERKAINIII